MDDNRPSMKEDDHPDHNMPASEHDGTTLPPVFRYKRTRSFHEQDDGSVVPAVNSYPIGPKQ